MVDVSVQDDVVKVIVIKEVIPYIGTVAERFVEDELETRLFATHQGTDITVE